MYGKRRIRKAVFPVAGLGTRFLPATKSIPKEIMPLVDRPLIQYAIDEARAAGIEEFIFVTSRGKSALEDYFDDAPQLAETLRRAAKPALLAELERSSLPSGAIAYVRQHGALGLGHAVWCARHLIGDEPFAVILPDDVIEAGTPCLRQMVDAHERTGGCMVAAMQVPRQRLGAYGVLDVADTRGRVLRLRGMVEKPEPAAAPSDIAVIGRYILTPSVLATLGEQTTGAGGEIQLTDAIAREAESGGVFGYRFEGRRYDCGSKAGFLQAAVAFALSREDLRDEFLDYLRDLVGTRMAAE